MARCSQMVAWSVAASVAAGIGSLAALGSPAASARNGLIVADLEDWRCGSETCEWQGVVGTVVAQPDGPGAWWLPLPRGSEGARFSGDGRLLAFYTGKRGVAISTAWGHGIRRIRSQVERGFDWAPHGRDLVVARAIGSRARTSLLVRVNVTTLGERRLGPGYAPTWSPHGRRIAYVRGSQRDPLHPLRIMVMRPDGRGVRTVRSFTRKMRWAWVEGWSDDSRSVICIASTRSTGGYAYRYAINVATGAMRHMGPALAAQLPVVSPDQRRVAYGGSLGIHVAPRAGGRSRVVAGRPARWSASADEWYVNDWQRLP